MHFLTKLALTTLTAAALLVPSTSTYASSTKIYVDDDKQQCKTAQFIKIQDAIDAANPGDTVYVCPGTYHERVTITKKLTLRGKEFKGQELPIITQTGNGGFVDSIVTVQEAADVRIRDLHLVGDQHIAGVLGIHSTHLTAEHLIIDETAAAIFLEQHSDKSIIQDNRISGVNIGIGVGQSTQIKITNNTLKASAQGTLEYGVIVAESDKSILSDNGVTNATLGIFITKSSSVQVSSNTIATPQEVGIRLEDVTKSTVRKNTVTGSKKNGIGIANIVIGNNTFEDNTITNSANLDAHDTSVGDKTAGTANTWKDNACATSDPAGLCKKK